MLALQIWAIVGLVVALVLAIVVWAIIGIEYKRVIERIRERAEDSGNESEGETDELSRLIKMGNYDLGNDNNL